MKYKFTILAAAVVFIAAGLYANFGRSDISPKESVNFREEKVGKVEAADTDYAGVIQVTEAGFLPEELTIDLNTEVEIINVGKEPHWPASDPHPTHTIYPEFDPKAQLEPEKSFKFIFTKPGVWGFHDHYNPNFTGKIIVREADGKLPPAALAKDDGDDGLPDDTCIKQGSQEYTCYEKYYRALVRTKGIKVAFADFKDKYSTIPYVVSQCHPISHVLGRENAKKYEQVSKAYAEGDSFCWSGYYHGVMEEIVGRVGRNEVVKSINTICADIPGKAGYSFDYFNCVHGLGHGVMAISNNELLESLEKCDALEGSWEESSCYGGAFMENVMVDHRAHKTKYLDPSKPLYPCSDVKDKYKKDCYLMQTSYMMKVTGNDFGKIFELCEGANPYSSTCWQSLGRDASGSTVSNALKTKAICELGKNFEQKSNCITGAVKDFVSYYHGETEAKEFCNSLAADLKQACLTTEMEYYKSFK